MVEELIQDINGLTGHGAFVAFLGRPMLIGLDGDPVAVKTRKAMAILGILSRSADLAVSRETLADMLWSHTERPKAMQSLRQAARQIKDAESRAGMHNLIGARRQLRLDPATFVSDLHRLMECVRQGGRTAFDAARELWRGDFLAGCEDADPQFGEWLAVERERIRATAISETLRHLDPSVVEKGADHVESAAAFLLHIDPAMEAAHRVLIRYYIASGQKERAEQQYLDCERELQELDEVPEAQTRALLDEHEPIRQQPPQASSADAVNAGIWDTPGGGGWSGHASEASSIVQLPSVSIVSAQLTAAGHTDSINLKEEIVAGLSSFRSFDLYQSDYFGEDDGPPTVLIGDQELGSYLLRFRHNERSGKLSVQFEDRNEGRILFNEIIDPAEWGSVDAAASQTVGRIHSYAMERLRNPKLSAAYAKWCRADMLMADFDPNSDLKALQLLSELQRQHGSFSRLYSSRALINLKKTICYPIDDNNRLLALDEILSLSEHAVNLDPWHAMNQRAYGLASLQVGMPDQARRAFLQAGRLNSMDPINLMSVAEGLAFAGDTALARAKADRAMDLFTSIPRAFYTYFSNVYFVAGDYELAADVASKASYNNLFGLTTRIASLVCAGKDKEALEVLRLNSDRYQDMIMELGQSSPDAWGEKMNFFKDPQTRASYDRGIQLVKRFFFGDRVALS